MKPRPDIFDKTIKSPPTIGPRQQEANVRCQIICGHIVNTSSILGHRAGANQAIYSASKYAVLAISEAAREDLAQYDIGVSALCPGLIDTNIITSGRNRPETFGSTNRLRDEAMLEQAKARFPHYGRATLASFRVPPSSPRA